MRNFSYDFQALGDFIHDPKQGVILGWHIFKGDVLVYVEIKCTEENKCESRTWNIYPDFWLNNLTHKIPETSTDLTIGQSIVLALGGSAIGLYNLNKKARSIASKTITNTWATLMCNIYKTHETRTPHYGPGPDS